MKTTHSLPLILGVMLVSLFPSGAAADGTVTAVSWGGAYQDALRKAFFEPAAETLGITLKEDTLNGIADVRLQVQSGAPTWDIVEVGSSECIEGAREGLFEKLDYGVISANGLRPDLTHKVWVASSYFSTVIAWSKSKFGDNGPRSWKEFWDVQKFPGERALYNRPIKTLEPALLADGVPADQVYAVLDTEEGLDRAFRKLEELTPHVAVWWSSGGQAMQLAVDAEVDMLAIWNGRIAKAIENGADFAFTYNEAFLDWNCFAIPKGSKNVESAMKMIAEMLKPEVQANLPRYIPYGPANELAFKTGKLTSEEIKAINSAPVNTKQQIFFDGEWWAEHEPKLQERYELLLQQ